MILREVNPNDKDEWLRMRKILWPEFPEDHEPEIESYFTGKRIHLQEVLVLERSNGKLGGFIELNLRNYAEGSIAEKVPFIEGWYVDADLRDSGFGRQLIKAAEHWALEGGFTELASDAEITNTKSIAAHQALGFNEVERIVCFIKKLKKH